MTAGSSAGEMLWLTQPLEDTLRSPPISPQLPGAAQGKKNYTVLLFFFSFSPSRDEWNFTVRSVPSRSLRGSGAQERVTHGQSLLLS